jgi:hypothetical protein
MDPRVRECLADISPKHLEAFSASSFDGEICLQYDLSKIGHITFFEEFCESYQGPPITIHLRIVHKVDGRILFLPRRIPISY